MKFSTHSSEIDLFSLLGHSYKAKTFWTRHYIQLQFVQRWLSLQLHRWIRWNQKNPTQVLVLHTASTTAVETRLHNVSRVGFIRIANLGSKYLKLTRGTRESRSKPVQSHGNPFASKVCQTIDTNTWSRVVLTTTYHLLKQTVLRKSSKLESSQPSQKWVGAKPNWANLKEVRAHNQEIRLSWWL